MDLPEPSSPMIDADLLENAARVGLSVDGLSERDLRLRLQRLDPAGAEARARRWAEENAGALRRRGERIEREGCFGQDWRRW